MRRRRLYVGVAALLALAAAIAGVQVSRDSKNSTVRELAYRPSLPTQVMTGHIADVLLRNGREGSRNLSGDPDAGPFSPAQEASANRAYPATRVGIAQTLRTAAQAKVVESRSGPKLRNRWQELGPFTLNVDRLATQTFNRPTQWSGRVTALAIDSRCGRGGRGDDNDDDDDDDDDNGNCRLYVAAAGGGIWLSKNALSRKPSWKPISADIPSTSMGSLLIDPSDPSGRTIYAGTGEESGSSDSEAGVGLYKSTDRGANWSLVPGSLAVAELRAIGAVAVDPTNPNHIFIGTDVARHGASSVNGGRFTPPAAPPVGLYESTDGGASFHPALIKPQDSVDPTSPNGSDFFRGGVTKIGYDPTTPGTLYLAMTDYGLFRSSDNGASYEQIYTAVPDPLGFGIRYEFAATTLADGKTRIYLGEGSNEVFDDTTGEMIDASKLLRTDDARTASPVFTNLSSPNKADPGFGSFDWCQQQCSFDMFVESPKGHPDEVWLGGQTQYGELPLYAGADFSNGRGSVRSLDGGVHWTDMSGDARTAWEAQHPDIRDVVFVPGNPKIAFTGSDGGVIRTNGMFSDSSAQCDNRNLSGQDLANCKQFLSAVPTRLIVINSGLRTLQFESVSVNPHNPTGDVMGGTQDNATMLFSGKKDWYAFVTGDGGASGIDAVNPNIRYHTYFGPQGDVNFHGVEPTKWSWHSDPLIFSGEGASFYVPFVADPTVGGAAYIGLNHVWRTLDSGGDQQFLEDHCYTNGGDLLFTGQCGDWVSLGLDLRDLSFGTTRVGTAGSNYVVQTSRTPADDSTLWAATRFGRVFITKNANATGSLVPYQDPFGAGVTLYNETSVEWTRIDDGESANPITPQRFVSGIDVDPADPSHAIVSYSGYDAYAVAAGTPTGHVFDVRYDATTGTATWTNISYDLGDQPITGVRLDKATGDIYAGTDFGVVRLPAGGTSWVKAADGLPAVAVYHLLLTGGERAGQRVLYAATHGRGVWRVKLGGGGGD